MKKTPLIATLLLVMGLLLLPACDEEKGTDPLVLAALYNSKYYLEFDADYDNNGTVDEHVKMRMREPFKLKSDDHWYQGYFINQNNDSYISIPEITPGPTTYHGGDVHFYMSYNTGDSDYTSFADHVFTFDIIHWDGVGGEIYAEFNGELSNGILSDEKFITLSNGKLFARIYK